VCGLGGSKGRLRAGYDADVLIVDGDLSEDLGALRRVRQVVLRGRTDPAA
jgi:imidazolonepropionase-like amidohydrolase